MNQKEQLFYEKLKEIFIGEKIEGKSGFANLMRMKSAYFDKVFEEIDEEIKEKTEEFPDFREELYNKLYTFLKRYFTDSGSILYKRTTPESKIYERVYDNEKDVSLFWKTNMLYYVKTEKIWKPITIEEYDIDGDTYDLEFDVSELEGKRGNTKKGIIFELNSVEENKIVFDVKRPSHGRKTKMDEIRKNLNTEDVSINKKEMEHIFKTYKKQNKVDFFINKDAEKFLTEQFDIWIKHYVIDDETIFQEDRLKKIKSLRNIGHKIINFISNFEDELVKIWNKPKFVFNSNYVITLNRIAKKDGGKKVIKNLLEDENFKNQVEEWKEIGILENFEKSETFVNTLNGDELHEDYQYLPIDTKHFSRKLKLEILSLFDELYESLDGWGIHSENYQALNLLESKFKKEIKSIYIDPPFNTGEDFPYLDRFQDSTWLTLMNNRLNKCKNFLKDDGCFFIHLNYNSDYLARNLLNNIFGKENFRNEIVVKRIKKSIREREKINSLNFAHDVIFFYSNTLDTKITPPTIEVEREARWHAFDAPGVREGMDYELFGHTPPEGRHWMYEKERAEEMKEEGRLRPSPSTGKPQYLIPESKEDVRDTLWTDFSAYSFQFGFDTEKNEKLLAEIIISSSEENEIVMDFFAGSGTTLSTAHKLGRKWIGIEMGDFFEDVFIKRMKEVLSGDSEKEPCGISEEIEWNGGGFFKYYSVEQYEQSLKKSIYGPSRPFKKLETSTYDKYVFMKDEKMLNALRLDFENREEMIDFSNLYPNVDIAETLSNLKGKKIKQISGDSVTFEDDEKIEFDDIDFETIKPLIWW